MSPHFSITCDIPQGALLMKSTYVQERLNMRVRRLFEGAQFT